MTAGRLLRLACVSLIATTLQAQTTAPLVVKRPDGSSVSISAAQLASLPRLSGRATAHDNSFTYDGIDLRVALRLGGIAPVDSLRRAQLRRVVIFVGADGYSALIAMSELDPGIGGRRVILVDREDGRPLPADIGPRRIIVERDARPTRWVRQVVRIDVVDVPE